MSTAAPARPTGRAARLAAYLARPWGWAVLAVGVVALLAIGSVHRATPTVEQRIAHLEAGIKCPSCADLSIAQSNDPVAAAVRTEVTQLVRAGVSDAGVERRVVAQFGSTVLLAPPAGGIDAAVWILPILALSAGAGGIALVLYRRRHGPGGPRVATEQDEALVRAARGTEASGR